MNNLGILKLACLLCLYYYVKLCIFKEMNFTISIIVVVDDLITQDKKKTDFFSDVCKLPTFSS